MTLPDKDLELISDMTENAISQGYDFEKVHIRGLLSIIDRQSKALEKAMERISEETTSIHTASIMIEIKALLNGN